MEEDLNLKAEQLRTASCITIGVALALFALVIGFFAYLFLDVIGIIITIATVLLCIGAYLDDRWRKIDKQLKGVKDDDIW